MCDLGNPSWIWLSEIMIKLQILFKSSPEYKKCFFEQESYCLFFVLLQVWNIRTQGLLNFHASQRWNLRRFFFNLVQCVQYLVPDKTVIYVENLSTFVFGCAACYTQRVEIISQATFCCLAFFKIKGL